MKKIINYFLGLLGYQIRMKKKLTKVEISQQTELLPDHKVTDIDSLADLAETVPGMVETINARFLFVLAFSQTIKGDVIEIGSWQGRSTSFIARAVELSNNGSFFAIDHFKGNVGKEDSYKVDKSDLSDLEILFNANMRRLNLEKAVTLINKPVDEAYQELQNREIRFLFIDGDHTEFGVNRDINLFYPNLLDNAIVVFDDFSKNFPGVIKVVDQLIKEGRFKRSFVYDNTFVAIK